MYLRFRYRVFDGVLIVFDALHNQYFLLSADKDKEFDFPVSNNKVQRNRSEIEDIINLHEVLVSQICLTLFIVISVWTPHSLPFAI